jgi:hypothetical protein
MPRIKSKFEASNITDSDFWFLLADSGAEAIQYAHKDELCGQMISALDEKRSLADQFANWTVEYFYKVMGNSPDGYSSRVMSNPYVDPLMAGRQWWWMVCTELGWFQIAPSNPNISIRSDKLDLAWHKHFCTKLFGKAVVRLTFPPQVQLVNLEYGGADMDATQIFFTNGIQDPWQWASIRQTSKYSQTAVVIDCNECAHCQDLHTPDPADPQPLVDARNAFRNVLSKWLSPSRQVDTQVTTPLSENNLTPY